MEFSTTFLQIGFFVSRNVRVQNFIEEMNSLAIKTPYKFVVFYYKNVIITVFSKFHH